MKELAFILISLGLFGIYKKRQNSSMGRGPEGDEIQCLLFPHKKFQEKDALEWAKENNFLETTPLCDDDYVHLPQFKKELFKKETLRTEILPNSKGVRAVFGKPINKEVKKVIKKIKNLQKQGY